MTGGEAPLLEALRAPVSGLHASWAMTPRTPFVDALRGLAVVLMVINHTARWWLDPAVGDPREAVIYTTMVLAGPTFLFLVGFSLALGYARALAGGRAFGSVAARHLQRSLVIAAIALGLNAVVFPHDVLGARVLLSIALAIAVVTPLVPLVRRPAGRIALLALAVTVYAVFPGALPALRDWSAAHPVAGSLLLREFPVFPWLALVLLGLPLGWAEATVPEGRSRARRYAALGAVGLLAIAAFLARDRETPLAARLAIDRDLELNGYWTAAPATAIGMAGAILALLAVAYWLAERRRWRFHALVLLGRAALLLYVLHLIVVLPLGRETWGLVWADWWRWGAATAALLAALVAMAWLWLDVRPRLPRRLGGAGSVLTRPEPSARLRPVSRAGRGAATVVALLAVGCATAADTAATKPGLDPDLASLYETYVACQNAGKGCSPSGPVVVSEAADVLIDAVASGDASALASDLVVLGMREAAVAGRIVSGWLPIVAIPRLAGLTTLQFVRPALPATQGNSRGTGAIPR
jgi:uncharacterized membrane protein